MDIAAILDRKEGPSLEAKTAGHSLPERIWEHIRHSRILMEERYFWESQSLLTEH